MLVTNTLFGVENKTDIAIERLKMYEPAEGYYLAFSGGKDSIVIKRLADMSGVKYDAHHSLTTIDPPDLIYYMRKYHSDVQIDHPATPFLKRLVKNGFPLRQQRWCCEEYKERGGSGRLVMTGVRAAESSARRRRAMVEHCFKDRHKKYLHVIIDWSDDEVWQFIGEQELPYCKLYDEGWKRIGCLMCPMASKQRLKAAKRYPWYVKRFIKAFEELYANRKTQGKTSVDRWQSGEEMFWWWLNEDRKAADPDQLMMFE